VNQDIELTIESKPTPAADDPSRLSPMNTREQALLATYDFLKHMSTLALVAMGGMLGLAQGTGDGGAPEVLLSVAIVGLAGVLALIFMAGVAGTQILQRVHKSNNTFAFGIVFLVVMMFAAGLGVFVGFFFDRMGA
jgi:hypothetical protein